MRFGLLLLVLALPLPACSSDDAGTVDSGPNACVRSGGTCAVNFPFRCAPGYEAASDPARKTACGKSEGTDPVDVSCCIPESTPPDTGTTDTGAADSSSTDATSDSSTTDSATDAVSDVSADGG